MARSSCSSGESSFKLLVEFAVDDRRAGIAPGDCLAASFAFSSSFGRISRLAAIALRDSNLGSFSRTLRVIPRHRPGDAFDLKLIVPPLAAGGFGSLLKGHLRLGARSLDEQERPRTCRSW